MKIISIQPKPTPQGVGYVVTYENGEQDFYENLEALKNIPLF